MLKLGESKDIENVSNYSFLYGDIVNEPFINNIFSTYKFVLSYSSAAESHVDRSISDPLAVKTNILGTMIY